MNKVADILTDESKWTKGHNELDGKVCLSHACKMVYGREYDWGSELYRKVAYALSKEVGVNSLTVCHLNDIEETRFEHIRTVIEKLNL